MVRISRPTNQRVGAHLFLLGTHFRPTLRNVGKDLVVCHGRIGLLHRLADLVLEQEVRGRRAFRRVRVPRFLDPPPFCTLPFLGLVGFTLADAVELGGNNWKLWKRHHLLHVQLRIYPHGWTGCKWRPHWRHRLNNLERSRSEAVKHMSVLVADFCAFSQGVREGIQVAEELRKERWFAHEQTRR